MASIVTMAPSSASDGSKSLMAVISFDFASQIALPQRQPVLCCVSRYLMQGSQAACRPARSAQVAVDSDHPTLHCRTGGAHQSSSAVPMPAARALQRPGGSCHGPEFRCATASTVAATLPALDPNLRCRPSLPRRTSPHAPAPRYPADHGPFVLPPEDPASPAADRSVRRFPLRFPLLSSRPKERVVISAES